MIALLCPTRARPEKCKRMIESVRATTTTPIVIYLAISAQDKPDYAVMPNDPRVSVVQLTMPDYPTCHKWNKLASIAMTQTDASLFMLAADDMIFTTPCWDEALLKEYNKTPHVYHLRDSRDENGTPHPIVTREYIDAMGYFLPPIFLHWFVDSWTVAIAKANDCFTHLKDYMLVHDKPSDRGQGDETHTRIRIMGWNERDTWVSVNCQHFLELEKRRLEANIKLPNICALSRALKGTNIKLGFNESRGGIQA